MGYIDFEIAEEAMEEPALIVLSFDPGVTTGWAVHRLELHALITSGFSSAIWAPGSGWCSGELAGLTENHVVDEMFALTREAYALGDYSTARSGGGDRFAIAMEDFVPRMLEQKRSFLSPVRVFSKYEYALHMRLEALGVRLPYIKQSASDAKNVVSDERLTRWQLYVPGSPHARDAQRHGVLLARKYASEVAVRRVVDTARLVPSSE
jgi:hypothetical protein